MSLYKLSKGRCWAGYEPVPGKEPYSDGSCRPIGSKKKKKEKKKDKSASHCSSTSPKPVVAKKKTDKKKQEKSANVEKVKAFMAEGMDMKAAIKKAYPNYTDEECKALESKLTKSAGKRGLWANVHAKRKRGEKPAKPGDKDYPDSKGWNKAVASSKKASLGLVDKLNLIRFNYIQPKQASLENLRTESFVKLLDSK